MQMDLFSPAWGRHVYLSFTGQALLLTKKPFLKQLNITFLNSGIATIASQHTAIVIVGEKAFISW